MFFVVLGGNKIVNVTRATPGDAPILGSFRLSFRGHSTKDIPMDITKSALQQELEGLDSIPTGGVTVDRSSASQAGGYAYSITFTDATELGGDVETLVVDYSKLTGNDAKATFLLCLATVRC